MISLFIDTSLFDVSIALVKEGKLLSNIKNTSPKEHSIYTTKFIEDILKENNLEPNDVNEIVVVNGPGSFTGIRIGVTIAKMYAYLLKINIKEITSLKIRVLGFTGDYFLSTIDAKHGNYYIGLYDKEYNSITEEFNNIDRIDELKEKYNPVLVTEADDYDIEEIIKYAKNLPSINPHAVNPVYLKLPEAMEKNDKRSS